MWKQLLNWRKGGSWKNLEVHARKIDVSGEGSEGKEESWRESFHLLREYKNTHKQNTGRNVDSQGHSSEVSDGNEGRAIGPWREGDPCYTAARNLAELRSCSSVSWKVELVGYETG